ncbi:MAG: excinuclease ABC subunit UvrC [bacterium]
MTHDELREKALALPLKPGVYIMRDKDGVVIYVGKAKALKNRVSSYFHGAHNAKTEAMIAKIDSFEVIIAGSEFEALVLENSLIKHHAPHYNILLKDDKGYPFIRVDVKSEYPTFSVASRRENDGAEYFGPFGSRGSTFAAIDALRKTFRLPDCSRKFPRDIGKERPCLNYHMGACMGCCLASVPQEKHRAAMERALLILKGKGKELTDQLRREMEAAAEALRFEEAAEKRDMLNAITALETRQHVLMKGSSDTDAVALWRGETRACFAVLHYISGQLLGKDMALLDDPIAEADTAEALSSLLRQFYLAREAAPQTVLLPEDTGDMEELSRFLTELSGHAVTVTVPKKGVKKDFSDAAMTNAREETERVNTREERVSKTAQWLKDALGLPGIPHRVESFDISNTGASDIVASMVVFQDGKPLKSAYRKFKLRDLDGPDDYASMRQVVGRRFRRYVEGDEKFSPLPDLLLIDGGATHAASAKEAMEAEGVSVPVFGMVKDDRHRTRALTTPEGEEIGISALPAVFSFIGAIQEEVHRFAITFHRDSHRKTVKKSRLDGIPNIGESRKALLFKRFKSIKAMEAASLEELSAVIPKNAAAALYAALHEKGGDTPCASSPVPQEDES